MWWFSGRLSSARRRKQEALPKAFKSAADAGVVGPLRRSMRPGVPTTIGTTLEGLDLKLSAPP